MIPYIRRLLQCSYWTSAVLLSNASPQSPIGTKLGAASLEGELTSFLGQVASTPPDIYNSAIKLLQSLESRPSCFRMAASSLLSSCQSFDTTSREKNKDAELMLDDLHAKYAARLAICELTGAHIAVPHDCKGLIPSESACKRPAIIGWFVKTGGPDIIHGDLCYSHLPKARFQSCLKAMHIQSQSWTSYSNARQNAFVMCQATRAAIEKEEHLSLFREMFGLTSELNSALSTSLQDAYNFTLAARTLQIVLMEEIRKDVRTSQELLRGSFNDMSSATRSLTERIFSTANQAESKLSAFDQSVSQVSERLKNFQTELDTLHSAVAHRNSELSTTFNDNLQSINTVALVIKETLETLSNRTITSLGEDFTTLHAQIRLFIMSLHKDQTDFQRLSLAHAEAIRQKSAELHRLTTVRSIFGFLWNSAGVGIAMGIAAILFTSVLSIFSMKLAMCCAIASTASFTGVSALAFIYALADMSTKIKHAFQAMGVLTPSMFKPTCVASWTALTSEIKRLGDNVFVPVAVCIGLAVSALMAKYPKWFQRHGSGAQTHSQHHISEEERSSRIYSRLASEVSLPPPYSSFIPPTWAREIFNEPKSDEVYFSE